tara:strand:- start:2914 stop:5055 length:2142 start_codon:yes stop_codon:yes gene_type:complete
MAVDKNELILQFKYQAQKANAGIEKTNKKIGRLRLATSGLRRSIGALRNNLLLVSFAFAGVTAAITKLVGVSARFEAVKTRLVGLTGSVENAEKAFDNFNKVAATTPFTLDDVVDAGAQLQAFGADANALIVPITDLAAFMGTTAVEAANAFGRAFAGGAGAADILRERGILNIIKTSQGLEDLSKTTLPEFREALISSIQDPVVGIAGSSERLSKTFTGLMSNMMDSMTRLGDAIGDGLMPVIKPMIVTLKSGTEFAERFIRGLTETSLETTIRELKEFGGNVEALTRLKELELHSTLMDLERSSEELNIEFKTAKEAQEAINEELEKREGLVKGRINLLEDESLLQDNVLFLERQISANEEARGKNSILRNKEKFIAQTQSLENHRQELVTVENQLGALQSSLEESERLTEQSRGRQEELQKQLDILKSIEKIENLLGAKPVDTSVVFGDFQQETQAIFDGVINDLNKQFGEKLEPIPTDDPSFGAFAMEQMAERVQEIQDLTDEGFFPEFENDIQFLESMNGIIEEQAELFKGSAEALHDLGKAIAEGDMARADEKIKEAAQGFKQFGDNIALALLNGQNLGDAVVNSIKAIAAELIAQQAALSLMKLFFPQATAAKAGFDLLGNVGKFFGFHQGGLIGGNANNVPIVAQSGEFVMQRSAVQSIGLDNLSAMNETGQVSNVTVNIHGGVVQEDYVSNTLIPAINKAQALS